MEELTTKIQSLTLKQSVPYEDTQRFTYDNTDPANLLHGSSLKTLTYTEYASLPVLISTFTFGNPTDSTISLPTSFTIFANANPDIVNKYRYVRAEVEYTFEINASWNHVGLFAAWWLPQTTLNINKLLYETPGTTAASARNDMVWYIPPTQRVFMRVGQTVTKTIRVPWTLPFPFWDAGKFANQYIATNTTNNLSIDLSQNLPIVYFGNLTQCRTIPSGIVPITVNVYRKFVNIQVGGFIGQSIANPI